MLDSNALMAPYVKSAALFKCPSDIYQSSLNPGPRIRSYSLDDALGGSPNVGNLYAPGGAPRMYIRARMMSELNKPGPANVYVILDEHPDSINDGAFMLNAGYVTQAVQKWRDYPGSFHDGCVSISFPDGHSEIHKWLKNSTLQGVQYKSFSPYAPPPTTSPINSSTTIGGSKDYEWLEDRMPYR
jgi:hypothetical protein